MRLENIKIKDSFSITLPKEENVAVCKAYWERHKKQDRYIVVDHNNILVDGYIQFLVLKDAGIEIAEVKISDRKKKKWSRKARKPKHSKPKNLSYRKCDTTYVFGILLYSRSNKERVWRIPTSWTNQQINDVKVGDTILVHNRKSVSFVKVTRIEKLEECPVDISVKDVIRKYN